MTICILYLEHAISLVTRLHGFGGSMGIGGIENGHGYIASISGSHYTLNSKLSSPATTCHGEFMTNFWGQH